ncbi:MAG TPA: hypothetical protein VHW65_03920 [Gemmatimonadales bacterium]|jgi:hypothetical protein|nr:hypothetical protein [Gemmatimonadales bacterium]
MPRAFCRVTLSLLPSLLLAVAAAAQRSAPVAVGSVTLRVRVATPDTVKATLPLGDTLDINLAVFSNGHIVSMEMSPGAGMGMPILQGLILRSLITPAMDTMHAALLFPHEMIAPGGPAGYRIDASFQRFDSLISGISVMGAVSDTAAHFRSLAMKSTVAGQVCEEWVYMTQTDTLHECLIAESPGIRALRDQFTSSPWLAPILAAARTSAAARTFGNRTMLPLRIDSSGGLRWEVTGISGVMPDSTHFVLPDNLTAFVNPLHPGGE